MTGSTMRAKVAAKLAEMDKMLLMIAAAAPRYDWEFTHGLEDELAEGALDFIVEHAAELTKDEVRALATKARSTKGMQLGRWYA